MNLSSLTHATAQSRKDTPISQHPFFRCAPLRLGVILLLVIFAVPATSAQEVADTIKVRTRVVFLDALVKEKKTGIPISDLNPENFEVFDDGQPRAISYFTREGQARKPLALILILDLRDDGAGRFLKRDRVLILRPFSFAASFRQSFRTRHIYSVSKLDSVFSRCRHSCAPSIP